MAFHSLRLILLCCTGVLGLAGCAYDDGYGGGYGGVSVGTGYYAGDGYGPAGYYDPGYYGGWYNDYYYPGSGYYVFDRRGQRHRWNDGQRGYWEARRKNYAGQGYRGRRNDDGRRDNDSGRQYDGRRDRDSRVDGTPGRRPDGQPDRGTWRRNNAAGSPRPKYVRPDRRDSTPGTASPSVSTPGAVSPRAASPRAASPRIERAQPASQPRPEMRQRSAPARGAEPRQRTQPE